MRFSIRLRLALTLIAFVFAFLFCGGFHAGQMDQEAGIALIFALLVWASTGLVFWVIGI